MKIYAVVFEYSYPNNLEGIPSPDDAGGVVALYEDENDAQARIAKEERSGEWGDFSDSEDNDGWSTCGFMLRIEERDLIPRSPFALKSKAGDQFIIKIDGKAVLMQVDDLRHFEDDIWTRSPVSDADPSQWPHQHKGVSSVYTDAEVQKRLLNKRKSANG